MKILRQEAIRRVAQVYGRDVAFRFRAALVKSHYGKGFLPCEICMHELGRVLGSPNLPHTLFVTGGSQIALHSSERQGTSDTADLATQVVELNKQFFDVLKKDPEALFQVSPRRFEEIVAALLSDMGCSVQLTPQSHDGGRDIFATFKTPFGEMLTIVECKRYRADRPIGIDLVERFLWTITNKDRASCGLFATTSYFSPESQQRAREFEYLVKLRDFEGLKEWISHYGEWQRDDNSLLWLPNARPRGAPIV